MIHDVQCEHLPAEIAIQPRFGGRFYEIPTPHLNGSPARATERVRRLQIGEPEPLLLEANAEAIRALDGRIERRNIPVAEDDGYVD